MLVQGSKCKRQSDHPSETARKAPRFESETPTPASSITLNLPLLDYDSEDPSPQELSYPSPAGDVVDRDMSSADIVSTLGEHGCPDLTNQLDMTTCGPHATATGSFSDVYRLKMQDSTEVAVKTTRMYVDPTAATQKHFEWAARELYIWSKCNHPNVLKLLGLAVFRNQIGMVTTWMENNNLLVYLSRNPSANRCKLATHIAKALAYLHASGIVHRNLKGSNVLISPDGVPMLSDVGNAVFSHHTLHFTATTSRPGLSIRWRAPELGLDEEPDTSSKEGDMYALGMTILEAMTGMVPYAGELERGVRKAVGGRKLPDRPRNISTESEQGKVMWSLLKDCWDHHPAERPTADVAAETLELLSDNGVRQAGQGSRWPDMILASRTLLVKEWLWERMYKDIITDEFKPRANKTVLEEIRTMCEHGEAFDLIEVDDLVDQLAAHDSWVARLPWTCPAHPALELDAIVRDVTGDPVVDNTVPTNEACTCICVEPVIVDEPGQDGGVVQCDWCSTKFHAKCVEGSCPFCDDRHWDGSMKKPRTFTTWQLIGMCKPLPALTQLYSHELNTLQLIIQQCVALAGSIDTFLTQSRDNGRPEVVVPQIRHFMRQLFRIQFSISDRADSSMDKSTYGMKLARWYRRMMMQLKLADHHKPGVFPILDNYPPRIGSRSSCPGAYGGWDQLNECNWRQPLEYRWYQVPYHHECVAGTNINWAPSASMCPSCSPNSGNAYELPDLCVVHPDVEPEEVAKPVDVEACLDYRDC